MQNNRVSREHLSSPALTHKASSMPASYEPAHIGCGLRGEHVGAFDLDRPPSGRKWGVADGKGPTDWHVGPLPGGFTG